MKKLLIVLAFLLAAPAMANYWSTTCTQNLADDGFCPQAEVGNPIVIFGYGVSTTNALRVRDALVGLGERPDNVECTQVLVDNGDCTEGQLGEQIPNPVSKNDFADAKLRQIIKNFVRQWETNVAIAAEKENQQGLPELPVDTDTP